MWYWLRSLRWYWYGRKHYPRSGYRRHQTYFDDSDIPESLKGKVVIVTGANSGIGLACAQSFAERNATVMMLARNEKRGKAALEEVKQACVDAKVCDDPGDAAVSLHIVDMSDMASISRFAGELKDQHVDVLVNNAGCMIHQPQRTKTGLDYNFAVNVAGPLFLTNELRVHLQRSKDPRVVWVSSGGMLTEHLNLKDLQGLKLSPKQYDGHRIYAQNKRLQVELAELCCTRWKLPSYSMHPGWVDTPALRTAMPDFHKSWKDNLRTPAEGADTVVWLATVDADKITQGEFYLDRKVERKHLSSSSKLTSEQLDAVWKQCVGTFPQKNSQSEQKQSTERKQ